MSTPPATTPDPVSLLNQLGAIWSPDFAACASGQLDASQARCVLCTHAPCQCQYCPATYENRYYLATGRPQSEPCGMRAGPGGECPRGHRITEGTVTR